MAKRKLAREFLIKLNSVWENIPSEYRNWFGLERDTSYENFILGFQVKDPYALFYFSIFYQESSEIHTEYYYLSFYDVVFQKTVNNIPVNLEGAEKFNNKFSEWVNTVINYITKHQKSTKIRNKYQNIQSDENAYLDSIHIENFFCIKDLQIKGLKDKKQIYFLGENGDGKTLLLQAITVASQWRNITNEKDFGQTGEILELAEKSGIEFEIIDSENNSYTKNPTNLFYVQNFFAYGVHRRAAQNAENEDNYGFLSLFSDQNVLKHPISLLKEIDRLESKKINRFLPLDILKEIMSSLLSESNDFQIDTSREDIVFWERGTRLEYKQLSEGYRSVLTWVMDLIFHLSENQPNTKEIQDFVGIVLVDEINLHLHPKWEYELPQKLRLWFPNIQFIFTTHSPIIVLGASEDAVFFKLYKENGETKITDAMQLADIQNLMLNSIITSPLFSLESARMKSFENQKPLDTSPDYYYWQIYELVKQNVSDLKKSGKVYFSPENIKNMIQKAITNVQNTTKNEKN